MAGMLCAGVSSSWTVLSSMEEKGSVCSPFLLDVFYVLTSKDRGSLPLRAKCEFYADIQTSPCAGVFYKVCSKGR